MKDSTQVELVTVTPDMAHDWLGFNTHNRPIRSRTIAAYAADMTAGSWQWNGESIKFAALRRSPRQSSGPNRSEIIGMRS